MSAPFIFLGVPAYDSIEPMALDGLSCASEKLRWFRKIEVSSLLPRTFNLLWCACLNNRHFGFTHFAMIHSDIQAPAGFLDVLYEELERTGADVIGVVSPIKDSRGLTSTGTRELSGKIDRLTMREVMRLPETFSVADVAPDRQLMLNTGLWLCRLGPWVDDFPGFAVLSCITTEDGQKVAKDLPEDWNWSIWLAEKGLKTYLTRKVSIQHWGRSQYDNSSSWGLLETDIGDEKQSSFQHRPHIAVAEKPKTKMDPAEQHEWCSSAIVKKQADAWRAQRDDRLSKGLPIDDLPPPYAFNATATAKTEEIRSTGPGGGPVETPLGDNPRENAKILREAINDTFASIKTKKTPTREIVAVRYAESMAWVHGWLDDLLVKYGPDLTYRIYDKGPGGNTPNIGNLDWTYLHHIVTRWDELADWTVFTQADPEPHCQEDYFVALLEPQDHFVPAWLCRCREWGEDGRINWKGPDFKRWHHAWYRQYINGTIHQAKLSLVEWFKEFIGVDINELGELSYHPGAIFAVDKKTIRRRPKAFYERLLANLGEGGHRCPEESHYAERSWPYVFATEGK